MAEVPPLKSPGKIKDFTGTDVALLGGIRTLAGEQTFQDTVANDGSVITLSQLLSGGGSVAWTDLTDTPGSIQPNALVTGNPAGTDLEFRNVIYSNLLGMEPVVTGVINPGQLELSVFSATQVGISAGDMAIARRISPLNVQEFQSTLGSAATPTVVGLSSHVSFWTAADPLFTGSVTIKEFPTHPTVADLRVEALLGVSLHEAGAVVAVINTPDVYRDQGQATTDLWRPSRLQGLPIVPGTGQAIEIVSTLMIQTTDATLESKGIGFHSSSGVNPNFSATIPGENPFNFNTIEADGTIFTSGLTTFPKTFNSGGTETALTGQRAAVTQVAWLADGSGVAQLGTTDYANYDVAVASIQQERISNPLWDVARDFGALIGIVVISNQATTLWEDSRAHLFPVAGGQVNVGGVTTFLALTDTESTFIERGNVQTINEAADALVAGRINAQVQFDFPGNIASPGTNIGFRAIVHAARFNLTNVFLAVKTVDSADAVIVDVNLAGVTIFSGSKPTLAISAAQSNTTPTTTLAVQGQEFTIDLDATGAIWQDMTVAIQGWVEPE